MREINACSQRLYLTMLRSIKEEFNPFYAVCHAAQISSVEQLTAMDHSWAGPCDNVIAAGIAFLKDNSAPRDCITFHDRQGEPLALLMNLAIPTHFTEYP